MASGSGQFKRINASRNKNSAAKGRRKTYQPASNDWMDYLPF